MVECKRKFMKGVFKCYLMSNTYRLRDVYKSYSFYKERAFEYCRDLVAKYNGTQGKIINFNSNVFTYGFIGEIEGKQAFFYITRDYDRYIYLEDLED